MEVIKITPKNIKSKLIKRNEIKEELRFVEESVSDFITPSGKVYNYYEEDDMYCPRQQHINKYNDYIYVSINTKEGHKSRRLHVLVAKAYLVNPKPNEYFIVEHKDNNKQNPNVNNLMWSSNQHNTQKAIDDGLNTYKRGIENENSFPIKVVDLKDNIVAVYGSTCECERMIKNIDKSYINKMIPRNGCYKPRGKKYKYIKISKDEYNITDSIYKNLKLEDNPKQSKVPSVFKAINLITHEEYISDNQKQFAIEHGLKQACISHAISDNVIYNNWKFELIKKIEYTEGSGYKKLIDNINEIIVENIDTHKQIIFKTSKELKDYFNIKGHDVKQYIKSNNLIFSKWKIIRC